MLYLRRETDYALQFLKILSRQKGSVSLREVAKKSGLSFMFLQKIARKLRFAGLVKAAHGVKGGYYLALPARRLTLGQVVGAVEGGCVLMPCVTAKTDCCGKKSCGLKPKVKKLNEQMIKMFAKIKLSDL